jgi:sigma-54 dependent transcriptional regulator, acetoin dehydrogenase operon transcriptional activator AcoR
MSTLNPYFYAYNPELLAFENAWIKFIKNQEINISVIRPEIFESWQRCYALGMDPLSNRKIPLISKEEINERLERNKLLMSVVTPYMDSIYETIKGSGFRVDFSDAEGYTLRSFCDKDTLEICEKTNSFPGANRRESVSGTNSIGIALLTGKPIQVAGSEHYVQTFHRWAGSSAPIKQEDGTVLGVLSVIGRYELVHYHTLALVSSAAKAIENELYIHKVNEQIEASNRQLRTTLETVTDGVVYLAKDKIMQVNRKMCILLGMDESEIVGKNVYGVIETIPELSEMFNTEHNVYREGEIVLNGSSRSYKCLFAHRGIYGSSGQETGKVLIFTTVEEIEQLAKKIKYKANYSFDGIIRQSAAMKNAIEMARKASRHDSRVMI